MAPDPRSKGMAARPQVTKHRKKRPTSPALPRKQRRSTRTPGTERDLWRVFVLTSAEAQDAVAEVLANAAR